MDATQYSRMASDAREKRDSRIAAAVREIVAANAEYSDHLDGLRRLKSLVIGDIPDVFPEPLDLTQFDGWEELQPKIGEPTSDLERIRRILPPRDEPFGLSDLKRRFADKYAGREMKDGNWPVYLSRLIKEGEVARIQPQHGGRPGVYAVTGSTIAPQQEFKSQRDVAIEILREAGKPMLLGEIVAEIRRRGVGGEAALDTVRGNVLRFLRQRTDLVHVRGSKWRLNSTVANTKKGV